MASVNYQPAAPIPSEILLSGGKDLNFVRPDAPSRCTWSAGANASQSPHVFELHVGKPEILPSVLHAIGHTPLVKLNQIPNSYGVKCEILAKCEFFNPGGSVKDRIAYRMVLDAERKGILKPGCTIIEPTSGNTGIGLAMVAAVRGYRCIIVMPWKMSNEKVDTLKALGAEIIRTPTSASFDSPEGLIAVAQKLSRDIPDSVILDQYRNAFNPIAHYEHTAQEIVDQCNGKVDVVVCTAGTGGTVCGIGRKIKELCPSCKVVAADPEGSILSLPEELNKTDVQFYEVEGIGYDFVPTVLDRSVVDQWVKTNDQESLPLARRLIREEGLLCGGSSGSALSVALKVAKSMKEGERVVVILPDSMRNYMTKFISDTWMTVRGLEASQTKSTGWALQPAAVLHSSTPPLIAASVSYKDAILALKGKELFFVQRDGKIVGVITSSKILSLLAESKATLADRVDKVLDPVREINQDTPLHRVVAILEKERVALIRESGSNGNTDSVGMRFVTTEDVLNYITTSGN